MEDDCGRVKESGIGFFWNPECVDFAYEGSLPTSKLAILVHSLLFKQNSLAAIVFPRCARDCRRNFGLYNNPLFAI